MAIVNGTIENIKPIVEGAGARGPWRKKSFMLNGEWYGGFLNGAEDAAAENAGIGDVVEFEMTVSKDGKWKNFSSLKVVSNAGVAAPSPAASAAIVASGNVAAPALAGAKATDNYQPRMNYIGAQTRAVALLAVAQKEGIELVSDKVKKADKLDFLRGLTTELTLQLAADSWNATEPVEAEDSGFEP